MPTLHLLGTGAAISDPHRTTTMLAFSTGDDTLVVDCGGDVVQRLLESGVDLASVSGLVITHEHPDHVSGFPLFMEKIWLAGRETPIPVYGIRPALDQARRVFEAFDTSSWDLPPILWNEVACAESAHVLSTDTWSVIASPGIHSVPVVGLRVKARSSGTVVAYSCDTEPADAIARLATDADILVHEANGEAPGHTSALQAAEIAREAGVGRLLLIHLPPNLSEGDLQKARVVFENTDAAEELGAYEI